MCIWCTPDGPADPLMPGSFARKMQRHRMAAMRARALRIANGEDSDEDSDGT